LKKIVLHSEDGQLLETGDILIEVSGVSLWIVRRPLRGLSFRSKKIRWRRFPTPALVKGRNAKKAE
jgi:hypothetical protein